MTSAFVRKSVAVLFQALTPPTIGGLRKDAKPGGYADSGADIAYALRMRGVPLVTPTTAPDPAADADWVFPDTAEGVALALERGAEILWANTVLFRGHPLEAVLGRCWVVGQAPACMEAVDDKFATNTRLREQGLPTAVSVLASTSARPGVHGIGDLTIEKLAALGLVFPLIVKPVRGRGSQGVAKVDDHDALAAAVTDLVASARFGTDIIIEQFLSGRELTVTVMPPSIDKSRPWALPPVLRFNHDNGVAPYNGVVAVTQNSRALTLAEEVDPDVERMIEDCVRAAELVGARAPIRTDCRADANGRMVLFDLNMKPNMTGAGRPGRDDQDSLSAIAARALGWSYGDLIETMLQGAWQV